ncbi:MAG TPA: hypothetical protein DIT99_01640 [Candidatus Latescibacteria bacterium]|nr:hypothetical protein [Candidatus Latescibacterota bacterium]
MAEDDLDVSALRAAVSPAVADTLVAALALRAQDRTQSVEAFQKQLIAEREESAVQEEELAPPPAETDSDGDVEDEPQVHAIPTATLAELYVREGLTDRAISIYLAMIEIDPTNPDIHTRLSELFVLKAEQDGP